MRFRLPVAAVAIGCAVVAGCGGSSSSGGDGGAAKSSSQASSGLALSPSAAKGAKGTVTLCLPKDVSGAFHKTIAAFNKSGSPVKAKLLELSPSADQQRTQLIQRLQAKAPDCDVMGTDVIWTAEFASQKWLKDLTQVVQQRRSEFIPSTLETGHYNGRYWTMPYNSNAALLYYRDDRVSHAPTTWEDVYRIARQKGGIVYQGAPYEGLTCDFLELLYSAGGNVLSPNGKSSAIGSPQARSVLNFMVNGIKTGAAPKDVTTYMEEEARQAFETGHPAFMRNWPYAYSVSNRSGSNIKGKFKIANLPGYGGKPGAGVLGGTNLAISAYSRNPGAALVVVNYFTSKVGQRLIGEGSTPPALTSAYQDPSVRKAIGLPDEIKQAITQAKPRPVSPVYPQISQAIYKNVNNALAGRVSTDAALKSMKTQIDQALATF